MIARKKISASHRDFDSKIARLLSLDDLNHQRYRPGPGKPSRLAMTSSQMHLITEAIFQNAFREYETFVEEVFILYCQGKPSRSGRKAIPFLNAKDSRHAVELIQSGMPFLEWNSPDVIISRSNLYLKDGFPIKDIIIANRSLLSEARFIRNHIAHNSKESQAKYDRTVRQLRNMNPINALRPGELLLQSHFRYSSAHILHYFLSGFRRIADALTF